MSGPRRKMFWRLLLRGAFVERGRALTAVLALAVAAAVSSAALNLYVDLESKMRREFRAYGANLVVTRAQGGITDQEFAAIQRIAGAEAQLARFAFAVAETPERQAVVVVGADLEPLRRLNSWWEVTAWPTQPGQALFGARAARVLAPAGEQIALSYEGRTLQLVPAGTVTTGGAEEDRIYLPLEQFSAWTGLGASTVEISVPGGSERIAAVMGELQGAMAGAEVRPVRQLVEAEGRVLDRTRAVTLAATLMIVLTVGLCVLATLASMVYQRRFDFAVMKALGASQRAIAGLFAAEAGMLGLIAGIGGYSLGMGIAAWIGWVNFHALVAPRLELLPAILAGSVALALVAGLAPLRQLRRIEPAVVLKGE